MLKILIDQEIGWEIKVVDINLKIKLVLYFKIAKKIYYKN